MAIKTRLPEGNCFATTELTTRWPGESRRVTAWRR
jgi:hypothetical protein